MKLSSNQAFNKQNVTILVVLILFNLSSHAQKMSLCQAFGQLTEQSNKSFDEIKGAIANPNELVTTYKSKIEIADAVKTEIQHFSLKTEFVVDYGDYKTEAEAMKKVELLKGKFTTCFPVVRFSDYRIDMFKSLQTNIIEQADKGFKYYKAHFKIDKWKDAYNVSFRYPATSGTGFIGNIEPNITEFITVPKPLENQQYCLDIRKIINEGKSAFKNIKGEKYEATVNGFECYNTNFKVDGVSNCYIEVRTKDIINFVIPITNNVDLTTIQKTADVFLGNLMSALGPDYAFKVSKNQMVFDFVHKNKPFQKTATFLVENNNNLYNLTIYISADIQQ